MSCRGCLSSENSEVFMPGGGPCPIFSPGSLSGEASGILTIVFAQANSPRLTLVIF